MNLRVHTFETTRVPTHVCLVDAFGIFKMPPVMNALGIKY